MKRIGDFALVVIAVILLVGLFIFKDYNRHDIKAAQGIIYLIDKRTGEVWVTAIEGTNRLTKTIQTAPFIKIEHSKSIYDVIGKDGG